MLNMSEIYSIIDDIISDSSRLYPQHESKRALAIAYVNLLEENPDLVTTGHLKMAKRGLSEPQILKLTQLVLDRMGRSSKLLNQTISQVFCELGPTTNNVA